MTRDSHHSSSDNGSHGGGHGGGHGGNHGGDDALRALERACDAALHGDAPTVEEMLAARASGVDLASEIETFELVIAQLECERFESRRAAEPAVPASLRAKLHEIAKPADAAQPIPFARAQQTARPRSAPLRDWIVAAACIAFGAVSTFVLLRTGEESKTTSLADPATFVSMHPSSVRYPWQATKDERIVGEVRGEAIFDPASSKGMLLIEGLAANDPKVDQYQLWIFDAERDERYPVDGGVFDMPECGHAVIPIEAKLRVDKPVLFAVTVERPGGVVVSDRRIALVAKP